MELSLLIEGEGHGRVLEIFLGFVWSILGFWGLVKILTSYGPRYGIVKIVVWRRKRLD